MSKEPMTETESENDDELTIKIEDRSDGGVAKLLNDWVNMIHNEKTPDASITAEEIADNIESHNMMSKEDLAKFRKVTKGCVLRTVE